MSNMRGEILVYRLHMGLYSLYIMNQGHTRSIDYVGGIHTFLYNESGAIPVYRLHIPLYLVYIPSAIPIYTLH